MRTILASAILSAVISWTVSRITARKCLNHIEQYVDSTTAVMKLTVKKIEEKFSQRRSP